jgi:RND family efflux transporter MFP subunit
MTQRTRNWLLAGAAVVAVGVVAWFMLRGGEGGGTGETAVVVSPENIDVARVRELRTGPLLSGSLEPQEQAVLRAQIAASVVSMSARVGDRVERGQLLGRLDEQAVRESYASAQSAVTAAEEAAALAARNEERYEELEEVGAVAEARLERARSEAESARSRLDQARARLAQARKRLEQTVIRSPLDGVVSERAVDPGAVVQPGMALITVVDPRSLVLEATVPAEEVDAVRGAETVRFTVSGIPDRVFSGDVLDVGPVASPATRQVPVRIGFTATGMLTGGLFAEGRVVARSTETLAIPVSALLDEVGPPTVVRIRGGAAERVAVGLGLRDERAGLVAVEEGPLTAGDTVLTGAARQVTPGTPVRIGDPEALVADTAS